MKNALLGPELNNHGRKKGAGIHCLVRRPSCVVVVSCPHPCSNMVCNFQFCVFHPMLDDLLQSQQFILFESSSGYAVFETLQAEEIGMSCSCREYSKFSIFQAIVTFAAS